MILGLRTAAYPIARDQLEAAKHWYAKAFGVEPYFDEPFYVGFNIGGFELGLLPDGAPSINGPQPLWGVDDIQAVYQTLIDLGATALEPPKDVGEGILVADVRDPFGNRLGLIQNPHFDPKAVR